jgi:hypothetical protein
MVVRWFVFRPKIPNLGNFGGPLNGKYVHTYDHLEYFMSIWYNLWPYGIVCARLVYFPNLECLDQEKSGNPDLNVQELQSLSRLETF